jgi:cytochrome P450
VQGPIRPLPSSHTWWVPDESCLWLVGCSPRLRIQFAYILQPSSRPYLAKLRQEIDALASEGALEDFDRLAKMPYLDAVINEGMRLGVPVPTGGQRISPPNGATIAGQFIPGDTKVHIPPWTIHRDPRYFSDPLEFKPERFIEQKIPAESFIPFSYGPFGCVVSVITGALFRRGY